jgi:hypothetical protein
MKKVTLFFGGLVFLLGNHSLFAQSDDIKRQINDIKMNDNYVYGEAGNKDEALAYNLAIKDLMETLALQAPEIEEYNVKERIQKLSYDRGDIKNVFVYLCLSNVASQEDSPTIDEPPVDISFDSIDVNTATVVIETDVVETDVFASDIIRAVLEREMMDDVYRYLNMKQKEGRVSRFEVAKNLEEIPDNAIVVLFDKTFSISAVLSQMTDGKRTNLRNHLPDNILNYSGHGVLWYELPH